MVVADAGNSIVFMAGITRLYTEVVSGQESGVSNAALGQTLLGE